MFKYLELLTFYSEAFMFGFQVLGAPSTSMNVGVRISKHLMILCNSNSEGYNAVIKMITDAS